MYKDFQCILLACAVVLGYCVCKETVCVKMRGKMGGGGGGGGGDMTIGFTVMPVSALDPKVT